MAYIIPKNSKKEKSLENQHTVDFCPICFATGHEIRRAVQFIRYKCEKCKHEWNINPFYEEKIKKNVGVVIRDKSNTKVTQTENNTQNISSDKDIVQIQKVIEEAINTKKLVEFNYTKHGEKENRLVQPYRLEVRNNELSLFCHDLDHDGIRLFKLSCMDNVSLKDPKNGN